MEQRYTYSDYRKDIDIYNKFVQDTHIHNYKQYVKLYVDMYHTYQYLILGWYLYRPIDNNILLRLEVVLTILRDECASIEEEINPYDIPFFSITSLGILPSPDRRDVGKIYNKYTWGEGQILTPANISDINKYINTPEYRSNSLIIYKDIQYQQTYDIHDLKIKISTDPGYISTIKNLKHVINIEIPPKVE
jgi:hypothetical protein